MKLPQLGEFKIVTLRECPPAEGTHDIVNDPRHNPEVESMFGIVLSTRRHVQGHYIVSTGTLDTILSHPREVYRPAIIAAASAIVLIHNHPSGDPSPSDADIRVTRELVRAGQVIKIDLLDHLIMGTLANGRTRDYCSLRELGYFYS